MKTPPGTFRPQAALCAAITLAALATGCSTIPMPGNLTTLAAETPAERQLREDQALFNETVISGVITHALAGCGLAILKNLPAKNARQMQEDCLRWATVGTIVGGADAYRVATLQRAGNQRTRALRAAAADVREDTRRLERLVATNSQVLAESKRRLDSLQRELASGQISVSDAEAARRRAIANLELMQGVLAQAKQAREQYTIAGRQLSQGAPTPSELTRATQDLQSRIDELEKQVVDYAEALRISRV